MTQAVDEVEVQVFIVELEQSPTERVKQIPVTIGNW